MSESPTVCLCAIVKNESAVIERSLVSMRGLIDSWCIVDTGSTDGTQDTIRNALMGVPGALHEREWVDFGTNRSESLELAAGQADYLLIVDADEEVVCAGDFKARLGGATSYHLTVLAGGQSWKSKRLLRADCAWRYRGAVHAIPVTEAPDRAEVLDGVEIVHHGDGGSHGGRLEWAAGLLERAVACDPTSRDVFYLAQTYRDLGRVEEAVAMYGRRAEMGGFPEEVFYSLYQVGLLSGDWPSKLEALIGAWEMRPWRMEPVYAIANAARLRGQHFTAYVWASYGLDRPQPDDLLFVGSWIYEWGLLFEYSVAAWWVGEHAASLRACDRLLGMDIPEPWRAHVVRNRGLASGSITV